jgi:hypothetical protein
MAAAVPPGAPDGACCFIKRLPERLTETASQTAKDIFAANAPGNYSLGEGVLQPEQIAVMTSKYWGPTPRTLIGEAHVLIGAACMQVGTAQLDCKSSEFCCVSPNPGGSSAWHALHGMS